MKNLLLILVITCFHFCSFAQSQQPLTSSEILQGIKKLNVVGSVLYIAAHPDDENTRLLTYLSKEKKLRTGYLSLTRCDALAACRRATRRDDRRRGPIRVDVGA